MAAPSIFDTDNSGSAGSGSTGETGSGSTKPKTIAEILQILKDQAAANGVIVTVSQDDKNAITDILTGKSDTDTTTTKAANKLITYGLIGLILFVIFKPTKPKDGN